MLVILIGMSLFFLAVSDSHLLATRSPTKYYGELVVNRSSKYYGIIIGVYKMEPVAHTK